MTIDIDLIEQWARIVFYSVSAMGILFAVINHFWFVKDRNTQTLISITDIFRDTHSKFIVAFRDDEGKQARTTEFLNVITVYCHLHNNNQLR